jgi:cell division protein FtsB
MTDESKQNRQTAAGEKTSLPLPGRLLLWAQRAWRPAATVLAVLLALALTGHVVNGPHGLQVWRQKRAQDLQLRKDIQQLDDENARLRQRIEHLKSDPEAIEHEAREKLHYAKPGEVIYTLPPPTPAPTAAK